MSSTNTYTSFIFDQYVVYHITYSGDKFPQNYIGSTSLKKIESGYMGSVSSKKYSSLWKQELKKHPQLFHLEIISYHDTRPAATYAELQIQRIFNVVKNPLFVNLSYAQSNGYADLEQSGENHPNYGKLRSPETRLKHSNSVKGENNPNYGKIGKNRSIESRLKQSNSTIGLSKSETHKKHISQALKNKSKSEEHKRNLALSNIGKKHKIDSILNMSDEWIIFNPSQEKFSTKRLKQFCIENNLNYNTATHSARTNTIPKSGINLGWKFIKLVNYTLKP